MHKDSLADVLFAAIIIVALWAWSASAHTAIISATVAYLGVAAIRSAANSETVRDMVVHRQDQITIRRYNDRAAAPTLPHIVEPLQLPAQAAQTGYSTFVAPVDLSTAKDAVLWALTLYGPDGKADPAKVNLKGSTEPPGRLKVAAPGNAAKEWLLTKRVIERIDHGYKLRIDRYPTAQHVRGLLS